LHGVMSGYAALTRPTDWATGCCPIAVSAV
jgi:hypothetical protein